MIAWYVLGLEVSTAHSGEVSSAPQAIHDFAFGIAEVCGGGILRIMVFKDQVVQPEVFKEGRDKWVSDFIVYISADNQLIAFLEPGLGFSSEILPERNLRVSVIVLALEITFVLVPN